MVSFWTFNMWAAIHTDNSETKEHLARYRTSLLDKKFHSIDESFGELSWDQKWTVLEEISTADNALKIIGTCVKAMPEHASTIFVSFSIGITK